jgi:hypothetical protein
VKRHLGYGKDFLSDDKLITSCLLYANNDIESELINEGFCEGDIEQLPNCNLQLTQIAELLAASYAYLDSETYNAQIEDMKTDKFRKIATDKLQNLLGNLRGKCEDIRNYDDYVITEYRHRSQHNELCNDTCYNCVDCSFKQF